MSMEEEVSAYRCLNTHTHKNENAGGRQREAHD